ncbi:MAG: M23 family metallopeptidase, partial [Treponema sp.]|nr:M23 family metallopeptidase [Treponema sp.]
MSKIISGQYVGQRKIIPPKPSACSPGIVPQAERNLMQHIKQNPVKIHRKKLKVPSNSVFPRKFSGKKRNGGRENVKMTGKKQNPVKSLLSAAGCCLLIAGAFLLLNWDDDYLSWMHREVVAVNPGADKGAQYDLALYAGLTPPTAPVSLPPAPAVEEDAGEAIPLDMAETFAWKSYKVKKGDSVSKIAAAHSLSMDAVIASNNISNARRLREGETLRLPNMNGIPYVVKKGDSLSGVSRSMGVPMEAILDANDLQQDVITAGQVIFVPGARMRQEDLKLALGELFIYPLNGARLTSPYGWRNDPISGARRHHAAIDLAAPTGTLVKAAMDGRVSSVGFNST